MSDRYASNFLYTPASNFAYFIKLGANTITEYYEVKKILDSGDGFYLIYDYKTSSATKDIVIQHLDNLGISDNTFAMPSDTSDVSGFKVGPGDTTRLSVKNAWVIPGTNDEI